MHAIMEAQHQVQRGSLLDAIFGEQAASCKLLTCEDQALSIGWDARLELDLGFDLVDGVEGVHIQSDGFTVKFLTKICVKVATVLALPNWILPINVDRGRSTALGVLSPIVDSHLMKVDKDDSAYEHRHCTS